MVPQRAGRRLALLLGFGLLSLPASAAGPELDTTRMLRSGLPQAPGPRR